MKKSTLEKEIKTAFKPATIFAGGYIVQNFLYLLSTVLIAKILDADSFGFYSLAWAIVGIGSMVSGLGFNMTPSKFIPLYRQNNEVSKLKGFLSFLFKTQVAATLLIAGVLIFSSRYISTEIYHKPGLVIFLMLLAGLVPLQKLVELFGSIFRGFKKVNYSVYVQAFFEPAYRFLFLIGVFLIGGYITGVFSALYSGVILALILAIVIYKKHVLALLPSSSESLPCDRKKVILYSLPLLGISIISYLMGKTDILMIGYFLSPDKIGIYNIAFKLSLLVALSLLALDSIFSPIISELYSQKDYTKLAAAYKAFTRVILYVSTFVFFSIFLLARPVLLLIGKDFTPGIYPLLILSLGQLVNVSVGPAGSILNMTKFPRISLYNSIGLLVLNILLNLSLIPRYGIIGAATATSISIILINLLRIVEVYILLGIHPYSLSYSKPLLAGGLSVVIIALMVYFTGIVNNYMLFAVFSVSFVSVSLALRLGKEEEFMLLLLRGRIFKG